MTDKGECWVTFVAQYADGTKDYLKIDVFALQQGDHVLPIIAREWQEAGKLRPGKIVKVYRF